MFYCLLFYFWLQEEKLQDEIRRLDSELKEQDVYIEGRKTEIAAVESLIFQLREGFGHHKVQRDKLQNERKCGLLHF